MDMTKFHATFLHKENMGKRLARAAFRLEMAELERMWAIVSAHSEGMSVREIAKHVGLGPTRVHQIVSDDRVSVVEKALSVLRELGWPAPEDPVNRGEEQVADRLYEEASILLTCASWLEELAEGKRPVVNLRQPDDWPNHNYVLVDNARIIRMLRRIAHDIEELARARRVTDLSSNDIAEDPCLYLRHQLCEPPVTLKTAGTSIRQTRLAWEEYERNLRNAGLPVPDSPYRHFDRSAK